MLEDVDKAKFHSPVPIEANNWTDVSLAPGDFQPNDDSPVKKPCLDPNLVSSPFLLVDVGFMMGKTNPNVIRISGFRLEHGKSQAENTKSLAVPPVIDGTTVSVTESGTINHPISIRNGGKLIVKSQSLHLAGNIDVSNGAFEMHGGSLAIDNKFSHQVSLRFTQSSFVLDGCDFASPFMSSLDVTGSRLSFHKCAFHGNGFTCNSTDSTIALDDVSTPGEFVVKPNDHFKVSRCRGVLLWLLFGEGQKADMALPKTERGIEHYSPPPATKLSLSIDNSTIMWAMITTPGADVNIRDSWIRAVGMAFPFPKAEKLANIEDKVSGTKRNLELSDRVCRRTVASPSSLPGKRWRGPLG